MRVALGILLLCCTTVADACGVVTVGCNFLDYKSPVVFVGTVVSPEDPAQVLFRDSPVVLNLIETLRGNAVKQVSIYDDGTSCAFSFQPGKSYLVFAYMQRGRLATSELTSTRPLWAAGALLSQLRAVNQGKQPASMFGFLRDGGPFGERPASRVTVRATSKHRTFTTRTGADGTFEFKNLPAGPYSIDAGQPDGRTVTKTLGLVKPGESCDLGYMWSP
jgi:hypothetical protein